MHGAPLAQSIIFADAVVVGRVEGGGESITQPSDHLGGPEEVVF